MKNSIKTYITSFLLMSVLSVGFCQAQSIVIKGRITDATDNSPLIGANVVEVDENGRYVDGTVADVNGNYILKVSSKNAKIKVSFISYLEQNFTIDNKTRIDVALKSDIIQMESVVVTGKKMGNDGVIPIRDRAVSVARIEFDELESSMTPTVEEMLQGRMGNVDITAMSGDPGAGLNIRIRGTASLNARNSPLIVVNGIPYETNIDESFDFSQADAEKFGNLIDVSPEDIISIEVLKDAGSTAIWGSKASNGVLMIETKRGTKSPPVFNYSYKLTRGQEPAPIPMLERDEYGRLISEMHFNVDWNEYYNDQIAFNKNYEDYWNFNQNTDWIGELTRNQYIHQHYFSVKGGGSKSRYHVSMGYQDENGTSIGTALKKISLRSSLDYDISSKLVFNTDVAYTRYDQDGHFDQIYGSYWENQNKSVRNIANIKMPNMSVYERDTANTVYDNYFLPKQTIQGNGKDMYNPIAVAREGMNKTYKNNTTAKFQLSYKPVPVLDITANVSLNLFNNKAHKFLPYKAMAYDYSDNVTDKSWVQYTSKSSIYSKLRAIYKPRISESHNLVIMGQMDTESQIQNAQETSTSHSGSSYLPYPGTEQNINGLKSWSSEFKLFGFWMEANYSFKDRYYIRPGLKIEATSRFSPEARWGTFPTVAGWWRLSSEPFMKSLEFINDLKIRASWGESGNSPSDNYLYFRTYNAGSDISYMDTPGVKPNNPELTQLKWEVIEQTNLGLSFFGLNNRVNIEFDVYKKKTKDLYLKEAKIPNSSGYDNISRNDGEMMNQGWEFMIDWRLIQKNNWSFSLNFNASHNDNVVLRLPSNYGVEYGDMLANGNYKISIQPGQSLGGFFGYDYQGVYPTDEDAYLRDEYGGIVYDPITGNPVITVMGGSGYEFEGGDAIYGDLNHDGIINESDLVYLGDLNPDLMGGLSPRLQIKDWTFNIFFYYKIGQKIINQTRMDTEKMYDHNNQSKAVNWRWRTEGQVTDVPRALYNEGYNWLGSSRFVEEGSFMRIKSASITYNANPKISNFLHLKGLRVYLTGYNLYTWTDYSGQQPDVAQPSKPDELPKDNNRTPPSIRLIFGLNIDF